MLTNLRRVVLVFDLISKTPQAKGRTAAHQALFLNTQALPQTGGRRIGQRRIEPRLVLTRRIAGLLQVLSCGRLIVNVIVSNVVAAVP